MSNRRVVPAWKQTLAVSLAAYCLAAWIFPVFLLPIFNVLPFVHASSEAHRLMLSSVASVVVVSVLYLMSPRQFRTSLRAGGDTRSKRISHAATAVGGLVLFTYSAAALSPNLFGAAAWLLPGRPFEYRVTLEAVRYSGSRFRAVTVSYIDPHDGRSRFLVLSKRIFEYPQLRPGDWLTLSGKSGFVGEYVNAIRKTDAQPVVAADRPTAGR